MGLFYTITSIIILIYIIHFTLVYRRFKREGDDFKLHGKNSWSRLEDYLPYIIIGLAVNALDSEEIKSYLNDAGLSDLLINIIEVLFAVILTLFALFGFNIYLKLIGWKKKSLKTDGRGSSPDS